MDHAFRSCSWCFVGFLMGFLDVWISEQFQYSLILSGFRPLPHTPLCTKYAFVKKMGGIFLQGLNEALSSKPKT